MINVDYINKEKNPADALTKNATDKIMNKHGYAIDPKWDDGLLAQRECQSGLIFGIMNLSRMSRHLMYQAPINHTFYKY